MLDRMPLSSTPQSYEARLSQTNIGTSYRCAADWTSQDEPRDGEAKDHLARIMFGISPTSPAGNWLLRLVAFFVFGYNCPSLIYTAIGGNCWPARCSQTGELVEIMTPALSA